MVFRLVLGRQKRGNGERARTTSMLMALAAPLDFRWLRPICCLIRLETGFRFLLVLLGRELQVGGRTNNTKPIECELHWAPSILDWKMREMVPLINFIYVEKREYREITHHIY